MPEESPTASRLPESTTVDIPTAEPFTAPGKPDWRTVPYWFAALAGFIYGTGFLVDFTFLTSMGVKDPMTEVVKARHIYVGLLCLQFPVSLCVVLLGFVRLKRKTDRLPRTTATDGFVRLYVPSVLTIVTLLFAFFILIAFSRPGSSYSEHQFAVAALFSVAILGLMFARGVEDFVKNARAKHQSVDDLLKSVNLPFNPLIAIRWFLFLIVLGLTIYIFLRLWPLLGEMLKEGAYLYVGLIMMVAIMVWRVDTRLEAYTRQGLRVTMLTITLAVCLAFAYFAILVFAARIYPYIPAGRGGGDYTTESPALLVFDPKFKEVLPESLIDTTVPHLQSKPLYILRDTTDSIVVAVPVSENRERNIKENGPAEWRKLGRENKPQILIGIKREAVSLILYKNE